MSIAQWAIDILLFSSLALTVFCCVALVLVSGLYNRMHYLGPVTSASITLLLAAVIVKYGWGQATIKTFLVWLVLVLNNAVLTHATARAARVRQLGHWKPQPKENIPGAGGSRA